jgi:hypothetical protein
MNGTCYLPSVIECLIRIGIFNIKKFRIYSFNMFICSLEVSQQRAFVFLCNIPIKRALTIDERTLAISHLS